MRTTWLGLALAAMCAAPALAQTTTGGMRLGAGLSLQFDEIDGEGATGVGVTVDVRGDLRPVGTNANLGWVGDFSLHNFGDFDFTTVGFHGGVAINVQANEKVSFYGQFLLGIEHCCETNAFSIQPGGGVNFNVTPGMDVRVGFDYRNAKYHGVWFGTPRLWFGISRVFGGM
jgi:hypothetical protein